MLLASPVKIGLMAQLLSNPNPKDRPNVGNFCVALLSGNSCGVFQGLGHYFMIPPDFSGT